MNVDIEVNADVCINLGDIYNELDHEQKEELSKWLAEDCPWSMIEALEKLNFSQFEDALDGVDNIVKKSFIKKWNKAEE